MVFVCFFSKSSPHCGLPVGWFVPIRARAGRIIAAAVKDLAGTSASGDNITAAIRTLAPVAFTIGGILALRIAGAGENSPNLPDLMAIGLPHSSQTSSVICSGNSTFSMALSATSAPFSNGRKSPERPASVQVLGFDIVQLVFHLCGKAGIDDFLKYSSISWVTKNRGRSAPALSFRARCTFSQDRRDDRRVGTLDGRCSFPSSSLTRLASVKSRRQLGEFLLGKISLHPQGFSLVQSGNNLSYPHPDSRA